MERNLKICFGERSTQTVSWEKFCCSCHRDSISRPSSPPVVFNKHTCLTPWKHVHRNTHTHTHCTGWGSQSGSWKGFLPHMLFFFFTQTSQLQHPHLSPDLCTHSQSFYLLKPVCLFLFLSSLFALMLDWKQRDSLRGKKQLNNRQRLDPKLGRLDCKSIRASASRAVTTEAAAFEGKLRGQRISPTSLVQSGFWSGSSRRKQ